MPEQRALLSCLFFPSGILIIITLYDAPYMFNGRQTWTAVLVWMLLFFWHKESNIRSSWTEQNMFSLSFGPPDMSLGPETSAVNWCMASGCISACWSKMCCDKGFLKYSRAHVTQFLMVAWGFLMRCCPRAQRSHTFSSGFCPRLQSPWNISKCYVE